MPVVSVIIPAHNVAPFLRDSAASVLGQTLSDLELIIVNDASTDETDAIADEIAASDPRVRVIHRKTNGGRSGALNTGIRESRGKFISFLDADDIYKPDKLEKQVAFLEAHPEIHMVYGDFEILYQGAAVARPYHTFDFTEEIRERLYAAVGNPELNQDVFMGKYIPSCSPLIRREVFNTVAFDESLRNAEDLDMWMQIVGAGFTLARLPMITYTYRRHPNQKSSNSEKMKIAVARIIEKKHAGAYGTRAPSA